MLTHTDDRPPPPDLRPWVNLGKLAEGGGVTERQGYLAIRQVAERLQAAGYNDSQQTVRRLIDAGHLGVEGVDWYRTERGGYRMVSPAAVDRLITGRQKKSTPPAE